MFDKWREKCGVVGVWGHTEASTITYLGLHALQHRGQESAGIVTSDGTSLHTHRELGLVGRIFTPQVLASLPGERAIGHVRYATAGERGPENSQPLTIRQQSGQLSVAHNGNLVNADEIRQKLEDQGSIFSTSSDTEVILHLVAREREGTLAERIERALLQVSGAYTLVFLAKDQLIAARDPMGFRPLVLGKLGDGWVVASETCAFGLIEAKFVREIEPGEIVVIDETGVHSSFMPKAERGGRCIFELIYFARPDSTVFGKSVYLTRRALGRRLAKTQPADVDVVIPVPDSGVAAALGYAEELGVAFDLGLIRSHYVGRTFIEPTQSIRHFGVRLKLSAVADIVRGKRVAVVDDSIVRGTTSRKIVKMLRDAGATEVHLRITSPPVTFPCFYGIDTPNRQDLLAASHTLEEITSYLTADSVAYLSVDDMHEAAGSTPETYCDACFTGDFRVPFEGQPLVRLGTGAPDKASFEKATAVEGFLGKKD